MQKWEYLSMSAFVGTDNNWHPRYVNGVEIQNWDKGKTVIEYVKDAGNEGWELISEYITTDSQSTKWEYNAIFPNNSWDELKDSKGNKKKGFSAYLELLDEYGRGKWELAAVFPVVNWWVVLFKHPIEDNTMRFRFKRPKE